MCVGDYYGNVPIVDGIVGSILLLVVDCASLELGSVLLWCSCSNFCCSLLKESKMGSDRPVELPLYVVVPFVENAGYVILLWPCVPMWFRHCLAPMK